MCVYSPSPIYCNLKMKRSMKKRIGWLVKFTGYLLHLCNGVIGCAITCKIAVCYCNTVAVAVVVCGCNNANNKNNIIIIVLVVVVTNTARAIAIRIIRIRTKADVK